MIRVVVVVLCLLVAGCSKGISYDQKVDDLGKQLVSEVKTLPGVSDASCKYDYGIDLGQHLRLRAILDQATISPEAINKVIDTASRTFWLSPANVGHLTIAVYSSANLPVGDSDEANKDRAIGSENIEDAQSVDRPKMNEKYGPRPSRNR